MGYDVYLGTMLLPIAPAKIQMSIHNKNETITLINDGEVNLLKAAGLTDIRFTVTIPQVNYPFARYNGSFIGAKAYLDHFEQLKTSKQPFPFIVSRCLPTGKLLFDTNLPVSLERYTIVEDAKNGFDLDVEIELKQYRPFSTKTVTIESPTEISPIITDEKRTDMIGSNPGYKKGKVSTNGGNLMLRKSPSTNAEILKRMPNHSSLDIVSKSDGWYRVIYKGTTGYAHASWVKVS